MTTPGKDTLSLETLNQQLSGASTYNMAAVCRDFGQNGEVRGPFLEHLAGRGDASVLFDDWVTGAIGHLKANGAAMENNQTLKDANRGFLLDFGPKESARVIQHLVAEYADLRGSEDLLMAICAPPISDETDDDHFQAQAEHFLGDEHFGVAFEGLSDEDIVQQEKFEEYIRKNKKKFLKHGQYQRSRELIAIMNARQDQAALKALEALFGKCDNFSQFVEALKQTESERSVDRKRLLFIFKAHAALLEAKRRPGVTNPPPILTPELAKWLFSNASGQSILAMSTQEFSERAGAIPALTSDYDALGKLGMRECHLPREHSFVLRDGKLYFESHQMVEQLLLSNDTLTPPGKSLGSYKSPPLFEYESSSTFDGLTRRPTLHYQCVLEQGYDGKVPFAKMTQSFWLDVSGLAENDPLKIWVRRSPGDPEPSTEKVWYNALVLNPLEPDLSVSLAVIQELQKALFKISEFDAYVSDKWDKLPGEGMQLFLGMSQADHGQFFDQVTKESDRATSEGGDPKIAYYHHGRERGPLFCLADFQGKIARMRNTVAGITPDELRRRGIDPARADEIKRFAMETADEVESAVMQVNAAILSRYLPAELRERVTPPHRDSFEMVQRSDAPPPDAAELQQSGPKGRFRRGGTFRISTSSLIKKAQSYFPSSSSNRTKSAGGPENGAPPKAEEPRSSGGSSKKKNGSNRS